MRLQSVSASMPHCARDRLGAVDSVSSRTDNALGPVDVDRCTSLGEFAALDRG